MVNYQARGNKVVQVDKYDGDLDVAICDQPEKAIILMTRAHYLNDVKRQYTASARLFYQVEQLPGFKWLEPARS